MHRIQLAVRTPHCQNPRDCSKDTDCTERECNLVQSTSGAQHAAATAEGRIHNTTSRTHTCTLFKGESEGRAVTNLPQTGDGRFETLTIWSQGQNVARALTKQCSKSSACVTVWCLNRKDKIWVFVCKYGIKIY